MNYQARVEILRKKMQEQDVSGVFIPLDASLEYFTGAPRPESSNTSHRQNSAEYGSLLITDKDAVYFNSRLSAMGIVRRAEQYPVLTECVPFPDADLNGETFINSIQKLGLTGKKLAYLQDIRSTLVLRLQKEFAVTWVNFDAVVQEMRAVKDPEEQLLMQKAATINDRIYSAIFPTLHPGVAIAEVAREIDRLLVVFGADRTSFNTSVRQRGAKDTSFEDYPLLARGYVLTYDYGVVYEGYCSDFGRTIFIGEPDAEMVKAHELMISAQQTAIKAMVADQITGMAVNSVARKVINDGGYDREFGHRLGHGIGKDVHERPFLANGEERILKTGMFFTVEPSLRVGNKGIMRVEDVIMVTPEGGKNLNCTTHDLVVID